MAAMPGTYQNEHNFLSDPTSYTTLRPHRMPKCLDIDTQGRMELSLRFKVIPKSYLKSASWHVLFQPRCNIAMTTMRPRTHSSSTFLMSGRSTGLDFVAC